MIFVVEINDSYIGMRCRYEKVYNKLCQNYFWLVSHFTRKLTGNLCTVTVVGEASMLNTQVG